MDPQPVTAGARPASAGKPLPKPPPSASPRVLAERAATAPATATATATASTPTAPAPAPTPAPATPITATPAALDEPPIPSKSLPSVPSSPAADKKPSLSHRGSSADLKSDHRHHRHHHKEHADDQRRASGSHKDSSKAKKEKRSSVSDVPVKPAAALSEDGRAAGPLSVSADGRVASPLAVSEDGRAAGTSTSDRPASTSSAATAAATTAPAADRRALLSSSSSSSSTGCLTPTAGSPGSEGDAARPRTGSQPAKLAPAAAPPKKRFGMLGALASTLRSSAPPTADGAGGGQSQKLKIDKAEEQNPILLPSDDRGIIIADCWEEIPTEHKKAIIRAKLTREQVTAHWSVLCNVMYFYGKHEYRGRDHVKKPRDPSDRLQMPTSHPMYRPPEQLLTTGVNVATEFNILEESGKGGFGSVVVAELRGTKEKVAIKKVDHQAERDIQGNFAEINFLVALKHPNIVAYYASYLVEKELWMKMEYMEGGTLSDACRKHNFEEPEIGFVAGQALSALQYMHSHFFAHRDLKSANIMMTVNGEVKLIDLGLACYIKEPKTSMVGSPFWMPPEMIQQRPYTCLVDVWSMAVCLLELCNRKPPNDSNVIRAMFLIGSEGIQHPFDLPKYWSAQCKDFIGLCLCPDPAQRPTVAELLTHKFLEKASGRHHMKKVLSSAFMAQTYGMFNI